MISYARRAELGIPGYAKFLMMTEEPKIPAKRAPMPEGYDGTTTKKQQGSPTLQGVGGVYKKFANIG